MSGPGGGGGGGDAGGGDCAATAGVVDGSEGGRGISIGKGIAPRSKTGGGVVRSMLTISVD